MGLAQSSSRYIMWAAQDGRLDDLLYHLQGARLEDLQASSLSPKRQAPIHVAAVRGHSACIQALREAGELEVVVLRCFQELHGPGPRPGG